MECKGIPGVRFPPFFRSKHFQGHCLTGLRKDTLISFLTFPWHHQITALYPQSVFGENGKQFYVVYTLNFE